MTLKIMVSCTFVLSVAAACATNDDGGAGAAPGVPSQKGAAPVFSASWTALVTGNKSPQADIGTFAARTAFVEGGNLQAGLNLLRDAQPSVFLWSHIETSVRQIETWMVYNPASTSPCPAPVPTGKSTLIQFGWMPMFTWGGTTQPDDDALGRPAFEQWTSQTLTCNLDKFVTAAKVHGSTSVTSMTTPSAKSDGGILGRSQAYRVSRVSVGGDYSSPVAEVVAWVYRDDGTKEYWVIDTSKFKKPGSPDAPNQIFLFEAFEPGAAPGGTLGTFTPPVTGASLYNWARTYTTSVSGITTHTYVYVE